MTTQTKHTELPEPILTKPQIVFIRGHFTPGKADIIVKACNNHYQLLEACKEALQYINDGNENYAEQILNNAITQAEGK